MRSRFVTCLLARRLRIRAAGSRKIVRQSAVSRTYSRGARRGRRERSLSTDNNALRVICGLCVNSQGAGEGTRREALLPENTISRRGAKAQRTASRLLVNAFAGARLRRA